MIDRRDMRDCTYLIVWLIDVWLLALGLSREMAALALKKREWKERMKE
jgi:hypothetical protein